MCITLQPENFNQENEHDGIALAAFSQKQSRNSQQFGSKNAKGHIKFINS